RGQPPHSINVLRKSCNLHRGGLQSQRIFLFQSLFLDRDTRWPLHDEPARGEGIAMNDGPEPSSSGVSSAEPLPPAGSSCRRRPPRWLLGSMVCLALAVVVALLGKTGLWRKAPPSPTDLFPLAPLPSSPYLNTRADAHYVGSEACRACHPGSFTTFS